MMGAEPPVTVAASSPPFMPEPRFKLWGDARPGDTIPLAGGSIVRDDNDNEMVDGTDTILRGRRLPSPALHVDVRV
jgi:hypothetical protein